MVLFNAVVEVGTLPDLDRIRLASLLILEPICHVTGQDRFPVGLVAVDDDPLGPAMPLECLAQESFGRSEVAPLAGPQNSTVSPSLSMAR